MSNCLKLAMHRESGYKQIKRYLMSEYGMSDADAQHNADKYNEGCRIYKNFPVIVKNCDKFPSIDIRDLNIKQLFLSVNMSWLIRHNALISKSKRKAVPGDVALPVDLASVQRSVQDILKSDWYAAAKDSPSLVASIMNQISDSVVSDSYYHAQR